ncbi:hypothetical protein O3G_MSEX011300 [Manduca sexta]|uniref:Odorant receptor n=1 Tax=Manduca sexta TaxID=7130 RepID=A0A922CTW8_MANSE|nr:hypothetical protein O3G_MSEX011300 [Manduca sexta]
MEGTIRTFHRILSLLGISIFAKEEWNSKKWLALQIFTFINGFITSILTSIFVIANVSDLFLFIQGACIWTTSVIMSISLGVCLLFRKAFRNFLDEMVFEDAVLEIPLIKLVVMAEGGEKMAELKTLVLESQEKLLKYTKILLKTYMAIVWLCAILYICTPVYLMITTDDKSLRLLAYPGFQSTIILLVGQEKLSPDTTKYYVHEFCFIQVVLMFCLLGQHVENELEVAVLEKWHIFNKPHQTNVRIFHTAVSQRMPIYIFGTIPLSLPTFTWEKLSPDTTKYYVHEFCFIQVVLMFCLLGQHVENEKWHIFNKPHQTNVRIFHTAVSQRMPIYIFGTIPLSLPTFTWVS